MDPNPNIRTTRSGASYATPIDACTPTKHPLAAPDAGAILTDNITLATPLELCSTAPAQEASASKTTQSDDSDETLTHAYPLWDDNDDDDSLSELSFPNEEDPLQTLDDVEVVTASRKLSLHLGVWLTFLKPQDNNIEELITSPSRTLYDEMPPPKLPALPAFFPHPHLPDAPCPVDSSVFLRPSPRSPSPKPQPLSPPEIWLGLIQQHAGTGSYHAVLSTLRLWKHNE
jgi:hypothetical protein